MSAIKRLLIITIVTIAMLSVAGCLGQSDRDKVQERYDSLTANASGQLAAVQNVFDQQNQHAMTEPMMKAWLADYRSQLEALQGDINATGEAAIALKPYLSPGSSNYATLTKNEEILQQYLKLYVDDYNRNADGYNVHWGMQYGNVSLL